jgi:EAL domain-containing protein (putative c-di-GMP-specific phosphodiesterase class I)
MIFNHSYALKNLTALSCLGVFIAVTVLNLHTYFVAELVANKKCTWVITCFFSILYIAPIKHWPYILGVMLASHIGWQLALHTSNINWLFVMTEFIASVCIAYSAKYFSNLWSPADFTGKFATYLPGLLPTYAIYVTVIITQHWFVSDSQLNTPFSDLNFVIDHLHLLEFAVLTNMVFLALQWNKRNFSWPKNSNLAYIIITAHFVCLYFSPQNLIPLALVMVISIYHTGLQGVALPSFVSMFAAPFIPYESATLLDQINPFDYGLLITTIGIIGFTRDGFSRAAKQGAPYSLVLSKSGNVGLTVAASDTGNSTIDNPLKDEILTGLYKEEFVFYLQPICDNITHKAVGFEALMRWHKADGSVATPDHFLDIALSQPAYSKFKDTSLTQLVPILTKLKHCNSHCYLAFNIDSTFIHSTDAVTELINLFDSSDATPNCLVIEIPETATIKDQQLALSNLALLRHKGFGIALDDFGMEHSNMDRIRDIPVDFVKIDRSFIVQMEDNPRSLAIIKALVNMAKDLEFEIIAEGIETQTQAGLLANAGVTKVQGYHYGRPKPVDYWLDKLERGLI